MVGTWIRVPSGWGYLDTLLSVSVLFHALDIDVTEGLRAAEAVGRRRAGLRALRPRGSVSSCRIWENEGFLGHQGPVQALIELDQLPVHLRHLQHTSTRR